MEKITTVQQLDAVCEELQAQGFGFHSKYKWEETKLNHIIQDTNKLNIKYNRGDLIKKYDGDFEKFTKEMIKFFGGFNAHDKLLELAMMRHPKLPEDGDRGNKNRTLKINGKYLILSMRWDYAIMNDMFKLLGFDGGQPLPYRSEYNKIPYETGYDDKGRRKKEITTGVVIRGEDKIERQTYANGNVRLTGTIKDFENLYIELREDLQKNFGEQRSYVVEMK